MVKTRIDASVERTGPVEELHRRAWSAMLRLPIRGGSAYFKAAAPAHAHEAALTEALARWRPGPAWVEEFVAAEATKPGT
jgi:hypothetical protein